jgi:hypothetical protein
MMVAGASEKNLKEEKLAGNQKCLVFRLSDLSRNLFRNLFRNLSVLSTTMKEGRRTR